jgi:2-dehydro-3-deoxyphosphogluconate aldolase/(4S)-4-hydroxy-2-oxoglutarate aldolase
LKRWNAAPTSSKVFPGELLGTAFVKAVRGPLPQVSLMPAVGVSLENVDDWIKAGCVALGVGGNLTRGAKSGDFQSITRLARQFAERIRQARGEAGRG